MIQLCRGMLCEGSSQNCHVWRRLEVLCDLPDDVSIQTVHRLCPQAYLSSPISICVAVSRNREIMRDELAFPSWSSDKLRSLCVCVRERKHVRVHICVHFNREKEMILSAPRFKPTFL